MKDSNANKRKTRDSTFHDKKEFQMGRKHALNNKGTFIWVHTCVAVFLWD